MSDGPSASLPVTGGYNLQTKENINFREIIRVGRASATVLGEDRGDHYITLATSTVEELNILDVITANAIVCRVTSVYPAAGTEKRKIALEANQHPSEF